MNAVVFVGPSLAGAPVPPPVGVELRGPAEAGDLYLAAEGGARVIGLVDGVFADRPTVWHKEILWALDRGVRVIGAASLGALRAAECAAFGMEGVGRIFERCRDCELEDDHELALEHAPAELDYRPLSEALVNVRATLDAAVAAGVVGRKAAARLRGRAEAMYFKELRWPRLLAEAKAVGWSEASVRNFQAWLPGGRVDLKRADALLLINAVAEAARSGTVPPPRFRFQATRYWQQAVAIFERRRQPLSAEDAAVLDELRLDPARFERGMIRAFARRAARHAATEAPLEDDPLEALRLELGIASRSAFQGWLARVRGDARALATALEDDERLSQAVESAMPDLAADVLNALRIEGRFGGLDRRAAEKRTALGDAHDPVYREAEVHALLDELCAQRRVRIDCDAPDLVARSLGLADRAALHRLLRRERDYLAAGDGGVP